MGASLRAPRTPSALDRARNGGVDPAAAGELDGLMHHSDRGSQYLSIHYEERLAEAGSSSLRRLTRR